MAVNLSPVFGVAGQLFDNNGNPLAGGKIFTYLAGTTTNATTYTSSAGNIAHSNPIILDGAGRVPSGEIWLTDGITYKFVVQDSANNLIGSYDNLTGINSNFIAYTSQQEIQTATAGQTVFTLTTMQYLPNTNNLSVFVDGVNQYGPGAQYAYAETDSTTVTFVSGLHVGASVKFTTATPVASNVTNAENVVYTAPLAGAVATTVEAKLSEIISVKDFGAVGDGVVNDTSAFTAAWAAADPQAVFVPAGTYLITGTVAGNFFSVGGVTISSGTVNISTDIDAGGNFEAKVTPAGEDAQINLSEAVLTVATSNRSAVRYKTPTSVAITSPRNILMGGFRFFGQYSKARVPVFTTAAGGQQTVSLSTNLGAESAAHLDGWYAVFACANEGDATPSFKLMPCLRAGTVVGSQITLCSAAEGIHSNTATTYAWTSTNNLNGVDCLVINETVDGRANSFSGRVTTISANTSTTVTLATIGSVGTFDWLLPAPPGFDHYCYLGMFYYETPGDVRNIGDSGQLVKAKMINTADPNWSATGQIGTISSPVAIRFGGYISPLATGVVVKEVASFSTSALGSYASYFDIDGSQHVVQTNYGQKEGTPTETMVWDNITIPFCFGQTFYYSNDGSLISLRSGGTLEITGWIEV